MTIQRLTDTISLITYDNSNVQVYNTIGPRYDRVLNGFMDYDFSAIGGNPFRQYYTEPRMIMVVDNTGYPVPSNNGFNITVDGESGFREQIRIGGDPYFDSDAYKVRIVRFRTH